MAIKVFLTGATGYIGGDILFAVLEAYPDANVAVLVRNAEKGAPVKEEFPTVRLVFGDLDSSNIIEAEAAQADFVIHTADSSDHMASAKAIGKGLAAGHSKENPGYWLHISGTGILTWYDSQHGRFGEAPIPEQAYDDWDGIQKVLNLPDEAFHRDIDKEVLGWGNNYVDVVKTAIICPPTIYGPGRGPVNQRSRQAYSLVRNTLKRKQGVTLGKGLSEWDNVHMHDLSEVFVLLIKAALDGKSGPIWGPEGYYFTAAAIHQWGALSQHVANVAKEKGYIENSEVEGLDAQEVIKSGDFEVLSWGLNSRGKSQRAEKLLGWRPTGKSLQDTIPDIIEVEAALLQL